jgi:hypothetical protein
MAQPKYRCPVCKKRLTKREFERAFKIHEAQKDHITALEQQVAASKRESKTNEKKARKEERQSERERTRQRFAKMKETIRLLRLKRPPQEYGPDFEVRLIKRLRDEYKRFGDDIQPTPGGKGGDVLHVVKEGGKSAGVIIYECKWTRKISPSDIQQAALAKRSRGAQFAVLVHCGTRRGFNGMDIEGKVTIVAPGGVLAVAELHRNHLIAMLRAGIEKKHRTKIANQLLTFINSPQFKNPIEEIVRTAESLKEGIKKEFKWHKEDWEKRWNAYGRIRWDGFSIQESLRSVLHGEKPKPLIQPRDRLALLAPAKNGGAKTLSA